MGRGYEQEQIRDKEKKKTNGTNKWKNINLKTGSGVISISHRLFDSQWKCTERAILTEARAQGRAAG